jgi:hypothetical protein
MNTEISNTDDLLDVRDIIARFEELEGDENRDEDDEAEFVQLTALLSELKGNGGDEQWLGDWYPITLIHESYWVDYCEEMLKDIGELPQDIPWYIEIDWEKTAGHIKVDYSECDFDGQTFYYR